MPQSPSSASVRPHAWWTWPSALLLAATLSGCGAGVTFYASLPSQDGDNDTESRAPESDRFLVDMAHRFGLMALFAEVVYRRDLAVDSRDGQGCAYLAAAASDREATRHGMPEYADGQGRWRRWTDVSDPSVLPCLDDDSGLYYETYVFENAAGQLEEAVIAFRGTENRRGQMFSDWSSNLMAFLGFEPAQYAIARQHMLPLIARLASVLEDHGQGARIYVTGHSLGGGLAQQTGYLSKSVKEVFTFNTSPVTNWSKLRLAGLVKNAYPIFHRVYHGGEILEKVRFVSTSVTQARYGRHDLGLQLEGRSSFGGHSMTIIACNFAQLIATRDGVVAADHQYPVSYILDTVLNQALPLAPCRVHGQSAAVTSSGSSTR